jgi:amino acid permease
MSLFWGSSEFYATLHSSREDNEELELLVHAYLRDAHYTSRRTAILNVIYSTFNVGLVALPLAAEHAGLPLFVAGIVLIAVCAGYTTSMIVDMAAECGVKTLEDLCEKAFGFRGFVFVSVSQIIFSMSLMCITLDVWADILQSIFSSHSSVVPTSLQHRYFGLLTGFCLLLPVCLRAKSLASLRWSSYFSVTAIIGALLCILAAVLCGVGEYEEFKRKEIVVKLFEPKPLSWLLSLVATFGFSNNQVRICLSGSSGITVYVSESFHRVLLLTAPEFGEVVIRRETLARHHCRHLHLLWGVRLFI